MPEAMTRSLTMLVLAAAAAVIVACGGDGGSSGSETPSSTITPDAQTENVGIPVAEGVTLRGHLFGRGNEQGVILSHMEPNDQSVWYPLAQELAGRGYAVLTYDFQGYGETDGDVDFAALDDDLAAAVRFMRDRGKAPVFLIGASMGATASLVVAADEEVAGVIALSPPDVFEEQNALEAVPLVSEPKLFVASEDDAVALNLDGLVEAAAEPKEEEIYPGRLHGTALLEPDSEYADSVRDLIFQFLQDHAD